MPFDPRMLQLAQRGIGMMAPPPSPFDRTAPQPQQPKPWWDQAVQIGQPANQPENMPDRQSDRKQPPSLLDMMMGLGRTTPQQYNQRIHGAPPDQQQGMAQVSPWAWLGSMGSGGPR